MLGGGFESDFGGASGAPDVEPENGNVEVFFPRVFFPGVEFPAFVDVFTTGVTAHREGGHEADSLLLGAGGLGAFVIAGDFGGVEFGWVALGGVSTVSIVGWRGGLGDSELTISGGLYVQTW